MASVAEVESRLNSLESRLIVNETQTVNAAGRLEKQEGRHDGFTDRLARLEERVTHLPTKDFVVKTAVATVGALALLLGLQIAVWRAAGPPNLDEKPAQLTKPNQAP